MPTWVVFARPFSGSIAVDDTVAFFADLAEAKAFAGLLWAERLKVISVGVINGSDNYVVHANQIVTWIETDKFEREHPSLPFSRF